MKIENGDRDDPDDPWLGLYYSSTNGDFSLSLGVITNQVFANLYIPKIPAQHKDAPLTNYEVMVSEAVHRFVAYSWIDSTHSAEPGP